MSSYTYKQESKNQVRHTVIRNAVELLTNGRSEACCVRNSYVRDLYDYFLSLAESHEQTEAEKIEQEYIREWEHIHSNLIGYKRPDELSVCYLSGLNLKMTLMNLLIWQSVLQERDSMRLMMMHFLNCI